MELRHLRYFVTVAELLNMRRAAEKLNISQPPLSRQIGDLEAEIGAKLLDRSKRKLRLTQAGEFFLKEAREILQRSRRAKQLTQAVNRGETGTLVIAYRGPVTGLFPTGVMRKCREIFPSMEIVIREMTLQGQIVALLDNQIDLGYVGLRPYELQDILCFESIAKMEMLAVLPSGHALARKRVLNPGELADENFIFVERSANPLGYDWLINTLKSSGVTPNVVQQTDQSQNLLRLVAAGFGVSVVPDIYREYAMPNVVFRPLKEKIKIDWFIAWRKDNESVLLKTFLDLLRKEIKHRP